MRVVLLQSDQELIAAILFMCKTVKQGRLKSRIQLHDLRSEPFNCRIWEILDSREVHDNALGVTYGDIVIVLTNGFYA
jgi:hypothetical protein